MQHITSKKGVEKDVELDIDKVVEYETAHEDWSIIREMVKYGKVQRVSSVNLLASFVYEGGYKEWVRDGFTVGDLIDVITAELRALGFLQEASPSTD
jgi:hypothetical protein